MSKNISIQHGLITLDDRALQAGKPVISWFTGLSGAGKSTLALAVEKA